jgi:tetratricopeptide (TPR) repeat protein
MFPIINCGLVYPGLQRDPLSGYSITSPVSPVREYADTFEGSHHEKNTDLGTAVLTIGAIVGSFALAVMAFRKGHARRISIDSPEAQRILSGGVDAFTSRPTENLTSFVREGLRPSTVEGAGLGLEDATVLPNPRNSLTPSMAGHPPIERPPVATTTVKPTSRPGEPPTDLLTDVPPADVATRPDPAFTEEEVTRTDTAEALALPAKPTDGKDATGKTQELADPPPLGGSADAAVDATGKPLASSADNKTGATDTTGKPPAPPSTADGTAETALAGEKPPKGDGLPLPPKTLEEQIEQVMNDGMRAYDSGNFKEAIEILKPLADTGNTLALNGVGVCHYHMGNHAEAITCFEKAASGIDGNSKALQSLEILATADSRVPSGIQQQAKAALAKVKAGKAEAFEIKFQKGADALKEAQDSTSPILADRKFNEAIEAWKNLNKIEAPGIRAYYKGLSHELMGNADNAIVFFIEAVEHGEARAVEPLTEYLPMFTKEKHKDLVRAKAALGKIMKAPETSPEIKQKAKLAIKELEDAAKAAKEDAAKAAKEDAAKAADETAAKAAEKVEYPAKIKLEGLDEIVRDPATGNVLEEAIIKDSMVVGREHFTYDSEGRESCILKYNHKGELKSVIEKSYDGNKLAKLVYKDGKGRPKIEYHYKYNKFEDVTEDATYRYSPFSKNPKLIKRDFITYDEKGDIIKVETYKPSLNPFSNKERLVETVKTTYDLDGNF